MANLLPLLPKLTEEDRENIALAMRRKGYLTDHPHYLKAAAALDRIALVNRKKVIAALREVAPTYPEVRDTICKLQSKCLPL